MDNIPLKELNNNLQQSNQETNPVYRANGGVVWFENNTSTTDNHRTDSYKILEKGN